MSEYICPAEITRRINRKNSKYIFKIFNILQCSAGYARADFILIKIMYPWFLEINTLPGYDRH